MVKPKENLTGKSFGSLTVIKQTDDYYQSQNGRPRAQWLCQCNKCNTQMPLTTYRINNLKTLPCGCPHQPKKTPKPSITPQMTFGYLTVIKRAPDHYTPSGIKKPQWWCECICKKRIIVQQQRLKLNEKQHCGCLKPKRTTGKRKNTYDLSGEFGIGYTTKNEPFWFDLEDYDKIKPYCWRYNKRGYVVTTAPKNSNLPKTPMLHNIIMPPPDDMIVDHKQHPEDINAHKFDNRKSNLRFVTIAQNCQNRGIRQDNTSGHTGVYEFNNRWIAQIKKGKKLYKKNFPLDQFDEACKWREEMEKQLFDEYRYKEHNP